MSTTRSTGTTARLVTAALGAVVVAIVVGIVGMHALSLDAVPSGGDHAAHAAHAGTVSMADHPLQETEVGPVTGSGHGLHHAAMTCVFMLAAAGALLLVLLVLRRVPRSWVRSAPAVRSPRRPPLLRVGTGPPPVWEFSVIRC